MLIVSTRSTTDIHFSAFQQHSWCSFARDLQQAVSPHVPKPIDKYFRTLPGTWLGTTPSRDFSHPRPFNVLNCSRSDEVAPQIAIDRIKPAFIRRTHFGANLTPDTEKCATVTTDTDLWTYINWYDQLSKERAFLLISFFFKKKKKKKSVSTKFKPNEFKW